MNIQTQIQTLLSQTGWTVSRLSRETGVPVPVLHRLKTGERTGMNLSTYNKLRPFLEHDGHHQQASGE